jgi:hypothetical protein
MQYTLILTETAEGDIQVTIPALPACLRVVRQALYRQGVLFFYPS